MNEHLSAGDRLRRCRRTLGLAAVAALFAAPAPARQLAVAVTPDPATWQDTVVVSVSGMSATACGASAVRLGTPQVKERLHRVDIAVLEPCPSGGAAVEEPFTVTARLAHLHPGDYSLVVSDTDRTYRTTSLAVLLTSTLELSIAEPAREDTPLRLVVSGTGCPTMNPPRVEGTVVTLRLATSCGFRNPPTPPRFFSLEQAVGPLPAGEYEVRLLEDAGAARLVRARTAVAPAGSCLPTDTTLCLHGRRFAVIASWFAALPTPTGGAAHALPLAGNDGSGLLWFFDRSNVELTVKAIDGCTLNGRWWIFVASGSDVRHEVRVTDTRTGATRVYAHPGGHPPPLVTDVEAFAGCGVTPP